MNYAQNVAVSASTVIGMGTVFTSNLLSVPQAVLTYAPAALLYGITAPLWERLGQEVKVNGSISRLVAGSLACVATMPYTTAIMEHYAKENYAQIKQTDGKTAFQETRQEVVNRTSDAIVLPLAQSLQITKPLSLKSAF